MLQDYVTSTLHHIQAAKEQICRQLPNTATGVLIVRKNDVLKDTDYLIASLKSMVVHLGECQQQVKALLASFKLVELTHCHTG